jgi:hypothetical protein
MAVWTFDFYIIPESKFSVDNVNNDDFSEIISWIGFSVYKNQIDVVSSRFPASKSWSNDTIQLGESDSTHIQLFTENNNILEISCSIDLRSIAIPEIEVIVEFMQSINSVIFYENNFYESSMHNLINLIKQSSAFAFCKDPRGYLEKLDNQSG